MRVPASPLLVFGFASAATVSWGAPASPAIGNFRAPHSPAMPGSAQNSPAPSHAATFGSPAPDHSATFSPSPDPYQAGEQDGYDSPASQSQTEEMKDGAWRGRYEGIAADVKIGSTAENANHKEDKAATNDAIGDVGPSGESDTFSRAGGARKAGQTLRPRYTAKGDVTIKDSETDPYHGTILPEQPNAFGSINGDRKKAGLPSNGDLLHADSSEVNDLSSSRSQPLGDNRVDTAALVSSRKGNIRRSRLTRGLGVTGLDGFGGSTGKQVMPVMEDLKALKLS